jgi:RNA polymerase-binding transcription factor DksA
MTTLPTIRAALEERLQKISARADQIDDDLSQPPDGDWEENAIDAEGDEVLEGVGRAALEEMRHLRAALAAIDAGTYGTCSDCGGKIAPERLEALPEATKCRSCA